MGSNLPTPDCLQPDVAALGEVPDLGAVADKYETLGALRMAAILRSAQSAFAYLLGLRQMTFPSPPYRATVDGQVALAPVTAFTSETLPSWARTVPFPSK